jgi:hypothetical protein
MSKAELRRLLAAVKAESDQTGAGNQLIETLCALMLSRFREEEAGDLVEVVGILIEDYLNNERPDPSVPLVEVLYFLLT